MEKIILHGIQYDDKSSYLKGTSLAPPIIKEKIWSISSNTFSENQTDVEKFIVDGGNKIISHYLDIVETVDNLLDTNNRLLTLGGDHSITYPIIKSYHKYYGSFDILHIDAHPDLYDSLNSDKYSHACPFARILEENLTDNLIQIGIRTWTEHQTVQAKKFKVPINEMKYFNIEDIPRIKNDVYISLDMDAFDPAFAPGVSHPEPGGFSSREVITIIQNINTRIIGADIVEYNPNRDINDMTAVLAAKMVKEIVSKMVEK